MAASSWNGPVHVFVSWSGDASKAVAEKLRTWLPMILQSLDVFVSSKDIEKGTRWRSEIDGRLATAHFGITCLTRANVHAPWIHFEAGALARATAQGDAEPPLFTLLVGLGPDEIKGPLAGYQHAVATKSDVRNLLHSLNNTAARLGQRPLPGGTIDVLFEKVWPELAEAFVEAERLAPKLESDASPKMETVVAEAAKAAAGMLFAEVNSEAEEAAAVAAGAKIIVRLDRLAGGKAARQQNDAADDEDAAGTKR